MAPKKPLLRMRYQGDVTQGWAEDEDACCYAPCWVVVKHVIEEVRPHVPPEDEGKEEKEDDLLADAAAIKKIETHRKRSNAKANQDFWTEAKNLHGFSLTNKAANQTPVRRSELERLQGVPMLTPDTIIIIALSHAHHMVPLRDCLDGKIFDISLGEITAWLHIFASLSEDDTRAFLAGEPTFYGAKRKVTAKEKSATSYQETQLCLYAIDQPRRTRSSANAAMCCEKSRPSWLIWRERPAFTKRWWRP